MTTKRILIPALLSGALVLFAASARAESACASCDKAAPAAVSTQAFDLAKAKAAYPLDTCIVSGEKLGEDMGAPIDYVYKEDGKPDRLVRFCCKSCIGKFKKDPAKYLKKLDEAEAAKAAQKH